MKSWIEFVVGIGAYFVCTTVITTLIFLGIGYISDVGHEQTAREYIIPSLLFGGFLLQTGLIAFAGFAFWIVKMAFK